MKNKLPRYIQIVEHLRRQIVSGELEPNTQLPNQRELAQNHGVSIMTVRRALELLEEEGLIRTEHGVGTFTGIPWVEENDFDMVGFQDEMQQQKIQIETRLLKSEFNLQHTEAQHALNLEESISVSMLERLRLLTGEPIVYQRSFLPPFLEKAARHYAPVLSLYDLIRQETGQVVALSKETIQVVTLTEAQAAVLGAKVGEPAFFSLRISMNKDEQALLYDEALMLGKNFVMTTNRIGHQTYCQINLKR